MFGLNVTNLFIIIINYKGYNLLLFFPKRGKYKSCLRQFWQNELKLNAFSNNCYTLLIDKQLFSNHFFC